MLGIAQLGWTQDLFFTPFDGLGASSIEIHGISNTGQIVGNFRDHLGTHGFVCFIPCPSQTLTPLDLWFNGSKAVSTHIQGLTDGGQIAGFFTDMNRENHGFLCGGPPSHSNCRQIDVTINQVIMSDTAIFGINKQGAYVGSYRDQQFHIHGFLFHDERFMSVDIPQSIATVVSAIGPPWRTSMATITGFFVDTKFAIHGFVCELPLSPHCFTVFDVTLNGAPQTMTQATALNRETVVGSFRDTAGNAHGFVCYVPVEIGCFVQVDAYGGNNTEVLGINDLRQMVGRYQDISGRQRAFITQAP